MNKEKYARFASFMIDTLIIQMFTLVFYTYIFGAFIHLTFTNIIVDFIVVVFYMMLYIVIALCYQLICYKFLKNSLGKELMRIRYYYEDGSKPSLSEMLRREFIKYYLLYATFFVYGLYSFFRLIMRSETMFTPFHDRKANMYVTWR